MVKVNQLQVKVDEIEHKLMETRKHFRFAEYDEFKDLDDFEDSVSYRSLKSSYLKPERWF